MLSSINLIDVFLVAIAVLMISIMDSPLADFSGLAGSDYTVIRDAGHPMFTPSRFRTGLHDMHDLMHDWKTDAADPVRIQMEKQLIAEFVQHKLDRDLGWPTEKIAADFADFMEVLHPYLDDIAQTAQPQGLAVFGEVPAAERRFGMVMQMLRKRLIESLGEDIDAAFLSPSSNTYGVLTSDDPFAYLGGFRQAAPSLARNS